MTTSSGVPEARCDAPRGARGAVTDDARGGEPPESADEAVFESCLYLEQAVFDGLARPLAETDFVVVDLETTGGSPADAAITEIAAVRTRGGVADWRGWPGGPQAAGHPEAAHSPHTAHRPEAAPGPHTADRPDTAHRPDAADRPDTAHSPHRAHSPDRARGPDAVGRPEAAHGPHTAGHPEAAHSPHTAYRPEAAPGPHTAGQPEAAHSPHTARGPEAARGPGTARGPEVAGRPEAARGPGTADGAEAAGRPEATASSGEAGAGEFATLVNPGRTIPPHVAALTGITDALVTAAPRVEEVLPRFIEFAAGGVLVAHNAPFDIAFLRAACARHKVAWPALPTLDTAALARRMLTTDEVPDCRLGTLADFFRAPTRPSHRALGDARATTVVLHGLLERLARRGVHTLEALHGFGLPPAPQRRRMRQLTAAIPRTPGVCVFTAEDGHVLHVTRSSDMYARACGYFTAAETREVIRDMISKTARIVPIRCTTALEAEVTEIRMQTVRPQLGTELGASAGGARCQAAAGSGADGPSAIHDPPAEGGVAPARVGQAALAAVRHVVAARPRFSGGWDVAWIGYGILEATAVLPRGVGRVARGGSAGSPVACAVVPGATTAKPDDCAETACLLSWLESPGVRLIHVEGTWTIPVARWKSRIT